MNTTNLIMIIGVIAIIALIALVAIIGLPKPSTIPIPTPIPPTPKPYVYEVKCYDMCFDSMKNYETKGYDPKFLTIPQVKHTCIDARNYNSTMGFCDKNLGTL